MSSSALRHFRRPSLPFNLCAHLQNTAHRRLKLVPVPFTALNASLLSNLLEHGFISSLTLGTLDGPDPVQFQKLTRDPQRSHLPSRRLWIEHKFRDENPVLRKASLISKPSMRVHMHRDQLLKFITKTGNFGLGEICLVRGGDGDPNAERQQGRPGKEAYMWEARQAIRLMDRPEHAVEVVCRVSC